MTEPHITESAAPLQVHFAELRRRMFIATLAVLVGFTLCYVYADTLFALLARPLASAFPPEAGKRLIFTGLTEAFFTHIRLAFWGGVFLAFPVIAAQVYLFLAPGLYKKEKRAFLPFLIAAPVLFAAGAALAYFYIFPMAWQFFVSFEQPAMVGGLPVELEARIGEYLGLVLQILFAFGLAFQLPIALMLLVRAGLVKTETLARGRKFALLGVVTASAILTPPDVISQVGLSIPLYALYELSILACRMIEKKQQSREATNVGHAEGT